MGPRWGIFCTPLRELIQNASDAVRARRLLIEEDTSWGKISIAIRQEKKGEWWLHVTDNGIGMSERILTGPLLEFGTSGWRSAVPDEFPGLMSKGMRPTGRFGMGFYSTFELGSQVRVVSRRFDRAAEETLALEFPGGLSARAMLRSPTSNELLSDGGTRV